MMLCLQGARPHSAANGLFFKQISPRKTILHRHSRQIAEMPCHLQRYLLLDIRTRVHVRVKFKAETPMGGDELAPLQDLDVQLIGIANGVEITLKRIDQSTQRVRPKRNRPGGLASQWRCTRPNSQVQPKLTKCSVKAWSSGHLGPLRKSCFAVVSRAPRRNRANCLPRL